MSEHLQSSFNPSLDDSQPPARSLKCCWRDAEHTARKVLFALFLIPELTHDAYAHCPDFQNRNWVGGGDYFTLGLPLQLEVGKFRAHQCECLREDARTHHQVSYTDRLKVYQVFQSHGVRLETFCTGYKNQIKPIPVENVYDGCVAT